MTAAVTRATLQIQADHVLRAYEHVAERLLQTVSIAETGTGLVTSPDLQAWLQAEAECHPDAAAELQRRFATEPYRRAFGFIGERLRHTRARLAGDGPAADVAPLSDELPGDAGSMPGLVRPRRLSQAWSGHAGSSRAGIHLATASRGAVLAGANHAGGQRADPGEPHGPRAPRDPLDASTGRAYGSPGELLRDLRRIQDALVSTGARRVAWGEVQEFAWQVQTFGFHLAELEVRQHSDVHAVALRALRESAAAPPPPLGEIEASPGVTVDEVVDTFRAIAELQSVFGEEACRRYVVSFTHDTDDVLAVLELARVADPSGALADRLDVVPLLEFARDPPVGRAVPP